MIRQIARLDYELARNARLESEKRELVEALKTERDRTMNGICKKCGECDGSKTECWLKAEVYGQN